MKKLLSATAALGVFAVLGAGAVQADVLSPALVWVDQPNAQNLAAGAPAGCTPAAFSCVVPPLAGNLVPATGSQISFMDPLPGGTGVNTITGFATSVLAGPAWSVVGNPPGFTNASLDAHALQNNLPPGGTSTGTILEFTGNITLAAGDVLAITHDDGVRLFLDALAAPVINNPGFQSVGAPDIFVVPAGPLVGNTSFALFYGECCSLPAVLEFTKNGVEITNTPAPEPASLALLGSALVGFGLWRRRRRTS